MKCLICWYYIILGTVFFHLFFMINKIMWQYTTYGGLFWSLSWFDTQGHALRMINF